MFIVIPGCNVGQQPRTTACFIPHTGNTDLPQKLLISLLYYCGLESEDGKFFAFLLRTIKHYDLT